MDPPLYEALTDERIAEMAAANKADAVPDQVSPYRSDRREE